MTTTPRPIPNPSQVTSLRALQAIIKERSVMAGMRVFHRETGDVFQINVPGFRPVVLVGAEASHFMLITARDRLRWRIENEPITNLLIHGVLVEDDESHDQIRRSLNPALHRQMLGGYVESMVNRTDQVTRTWTEQSPVDMLVEMRKIALLILMHTLFDIDYTDELRRLWDAVLYLINYISPGLWLFWKGIPHPGYKKARQQMDGYLYQIIRIRREQLNKKDFEHRQDMLSLLIEGGMSDALIRDQLMTMLIAGHDTGTAAMAWTLYMLGQHPDVQRTAQHEIDTLLGDQPPTAENFSELGYVKQVIDETLRLYPPIHLGSRVAKEDLDFGDYLIPRNTRVLYSIYLTQRNPAYWEHPDCFNPERFAPNIKHEPYNFLPFGGGPRNCIGMAFAQVETRVVIARILQQFTLEKRGGPVHEHMGATLEPRPGVMMQVKRRG